MHPSPDTTLTALAQLAALKLNVKRGVVSLIASDVRIILAEATQLTSLAEGSSNVSLGAGPAPRRECIDEHVLGSTWTTTTADGQEQSLCALVINDVADDDRFKNRPCVISEPAVRFYAGVPIVTKQGYEIGVYAVSDESPRPEGLSLDQILYMQDVAQIVAGHLERVKTTVDKERDEAFVRGISTFIEGLSALKHSHNDPIDEMQVRSATEETDVRATDPQDEPPQAPTQRAESACSAETSTTGTDGQEADLQNIPRHTTSTEATNWDSSDVLTGDVRQIFARAARTIQEGIAAQGCIFLDSSWGVFPAAAEGTSSQTLSAQAQSALQGDSDYGWDSENDISLHDPIATDGDKPDQQDLPRQTSEAVLGKMATVLGASLAEPSELSPGNFIKRKHLKQCLLRYPFGQYFFLNRGNFAPSNPSVSDQAITGGGSDARTLSRMTSRRTMRAQGSHTKCLPRHLLAQIPDAKWIIFLPLYDFAHQQWFATGIVWSNESNIGDLEAVMPYLKTFGSCIMSEVASLEAFNTSTAKSTFIASISHDLRSPLHGLLGSLEFLEDTMNSAYQMSLVDSIETCGKTLLDTIDHLLDYAKINNLNRAGPDRASKPSHAEIHHTDNATDREADSSNTTTFDFALLLEEVVEAVFAGQTFRKLKPRNRDPVDHATEKIKAIGLDDSKTTDQQIHGGSAKFSGKVFFILDIDNTQSWCMRGQTGALRRIVMNIVGNAIKYCHKGCIEIIPTTKQIDDSHANVEINVKDTGVGMSKRFLQNHLFKAFTQEDSFTAGAGLGLSITSQIVQNLDGKISVNSEKGVGTHVNVVLPMQIAPQSACEEDEILQAAARVTTGRKICLLNPMIDGVEVDGRQLSKLQSSIARTCKDWFQMTCYESKVVDAASDASVYVYCEPPPIEYLLQHHSDRKAAGMSGKEAALLIICTNAFEAAALRAAGISHLTSLGRIVEVISQPVGARKLAKVLLQSLQRVEATSTSHESRAAPNVAKHSFATDEAQQRASQVEWTISSTVYDQSVARYRPSVQTFQWKSEQALTKVFSQNTSSESNTTFGDIKRGDVPGLGSIPHKDAVSTEGISEPPYLLLVDDNAINLKLLVTFMKKIKLPYAEAVNGLEALTEFKQAKEAGRPFDFVLMDLQMPVMDGLESTRKIREYEKESQIKKPATIIAITGVGSESVRKDAMDAGMSQFLTKPVKFKTLQQLLEQ